MTKNEFKQGDKVKLKNYKEFTCDGELTYIDTDEIGVIVQVFGNDWLNVEFSDMPILEELHWSEVVLAEPQEVKTAFLTELRALLKSHDATIQSYMSGFDTVGLCIYFGDENIGEVDYQHNDTICEIDADNIMGFDKE